MCDITSDMIVNAIKDAVWYNDLEAFIRHWIAVLENADNDYVLCPTTYEVLKEHRDLQFIWMIIVLMFGDYGTSPRGGWVESDKRNDTIMFLKNILSDDN